MSPFGTYIDVSVYPCTNLTSSRIRTILWNTIRVLCSPILWTLFVGVLVESKRTKRRNPPVVHCQRVMRNPIQLHTRKKGGIITSGVVLRQ